MVDLGIDARIHVTVCTRQRKPWLACEAIHLLLRETWTDSRDWLTGSYVIMPGPLSPDRGLQQRGHFARRVGEVPFGLDWSRTATTGHTRGRSTTLGSPGAEITTGAAERLSRSFALHGGVIYRCAAGFAPRKIKRLNGNVPQRLRHVVRQWPERCHIRYGQA